MKRYWFRRDSPVHWTPATWEGWLTIAAWILVGPVLGSAACLIKPIGIGIFVFCAWTVFSAVMLVVFIISNSDPETAPDESAGE